MATEGQSSGFVEAAQNHVSEGAGVGAAAFIGNYVLIYILTAIDGLQNLGEIATWKAVGWVFYAAHMVDAEASVMGQTQSFNVFEGTGTQGLTSTIPETVYYLVPVVVLLAAGYVVYQRVGDDLSTEAAAGVGATIAAGYVVLAAIGTFLFKESIGGASVAPKLTTSIAIAGLAYPIVLGAAGAVAASES